VARYTIVKIQVFVQLIPILECEYAVLSEVTISLVQQLCYVQFGISIPSFTARVQFLQG